ncbi:hypothetical protein CAEBREN_09172 [Caenorhabditis brenneri]|uniref:CUB domain-containing protein n=1 Tax=Caenorhabditis brenneri TaxID=135651 RepID=G0PDK0_CAEBE|nr:hypothetical protein CAEBREN_09172 [Caenorhabditis brenneri]
MKFRFFALLVGLLLVSSSLTAGTESSSTDVPSTTPAGSATSDSSPASTAASDSSSPVTSPSDASTLTPDPSATTPTAGSTQPAGSTVTGGSSSDAPVVTTPGGPTVSQGPTTTAPLPNVTYSLVQFGAPVCVDATCTYEIDAPVNNQAVLATDQSLINDDRSKFGVLQANASSVDAKVKNANDDAQRKINELQSLLDQIQANLAYIQNATKTIQTQQNAAKTSLTFVEQFISDISKATDSCLYMRCLKPTTPAPPTTTPTPAPTTSPSPCVNFTCPEDVTGAAKCQLDPNGNKPYCTNCLANFDRYNHCDTVSCSASGNPINSNSTDTFSWYSTGYNQTSPTDSSVPANANCVWNLPIGPLKVNTGDFSFDCLSTQKVTLTFTSADATLSQDVSATTTSRVLNSLLGKVINGTITLKSTSVVPSYCSIYLTKIPPSGMIMEEGEMVEKKNGFFSWLMGY